MLTNTKKLNHKNTFDTFWVMINLSGPRYWKVTPDTIEKTSAPSATEGPVICFDEASDFRIALPKKGSVAQATKYFLTEKQEKCRVFTGPRGNIGSETYTPFYGTPVTRVEQFEHRIYPGAYFIDVLLQQQKIKLNEDRVIGFKLQHDDEDGFCIIVLFAVRPNGDISEPQVSLNPPEFDLIVRDYAQRNGIEQTEPLLFNIEDLHKVPLGIGYPVEPMLGNTPIRYITSLVAIGLMGVSCVSFVYSGYLWLGAQSARENTTRLNAQTEQVKRQINTIVQSNIGQLSELTSVRYNKLFEYALVIHQDNITFDRALINREKGQFFVTANLFQSATRTNLIPFDYTLVTKALKKELPEGLTRTNILIGNNTNAYKIEYEFKALDSNIHSALGIK